MRIIGGLAICFGVLSSLERPCSAAPVAPPRAEPKAENARLELARSEARAWFVQGKAAYESGDYPAAISAFRASYDLVPAPAILFNIAQAMRLGGRCEEAADHYRRFRDSGLALPADFASLYAQALECADDEQKVVDAEDKSTPTLPQAPPAAEFPAVPPATAPLSRPHDAAVVTQSERAAVPSKPIAQAALAPDDDWRPAKTAGFACLGLSLGSAVAGTILALEASIAAKEASNLSEGGKATWDAEAQANEDFGQKAATWSKVLFAASAVSAGAGLWLWLHTPQTERAALGIHVAQAGATGTFRARF